MCEDSPCCGCCGDSYGYADFYYGDFDFDYGDFDSYAEDYGYEFEE